MRTPMRFTISTSLAIIFSVKVPQHLYRHLHLVLLSGVMALVCSGCWWFRQAPPPGRLAVWEVRRLAVVNFADATGQDIGQRVSQTFQGELANALGKEWVRHHQLEAPPSAPPPVGLIGISQAQQLGRLNQVDALLSGQVVVYQWQQSQGRVWVTVRLRLLETQRGTILWSRTATGTAPVQQPSELNAGFNVATRLAAKEFIDDLLVTPP